MDRCPACDQELAPGSPECSRCGVVLARYRPRPPVPPRPSGAPPARPAPPGRLLAAIAVGLALGALVIGAYWVLRIRPRLDRIGGLRTDPRPARPVRVRARVDPAAEFDRSVPLPIDPLGASARDGELLVGNRRGPGSLLRVRRAGEDELHLRSVAVTEPVDGQVVSFDGLGWDGARWVALLDGAWLGRNARDAFAFLDAESLALAGHQPAPPFLGALAWDGMGWWAATRKNTVDAPEEAWLYRLDPSFREVARFPPPGVGCQGLAWDGSRLWFADVFSDRVSVLDVSGEAPRVVTSRPTPFSYLSGIAAFEGEIWVTEYDTRGLHRLNPRVRAAWSGGMPLPDDGPTDAEEEAGP